MGYGKFFVYGYDGELFVCSDSVLFFSVSFSFFGSIVSYLHLFYHDHVPSVCVLHAFSLSPFRICDSLSTAIISRPCLNFPLTHALLAHAHSR
jgi:hypothetical protein